MKLWKLIALASALIAPTVFAQTYNVDAKASEMYWKGTKVGGMHDGYAPFQSGNLVFDKGELKSGEFVVNLDKMTSKDLSGDMAAKLIGHLKSDDFFSTAKHPTTKLTFNNVKKLADNKYEVKGTLTVKNISQPVTFQANVKNDGDKVTGSTELTFDRTKFDVKYNSGNFFKDLGDKLIHDDVQLKVNLVANKKD